MRRALAAALLVVIVSGPAAAQPDVPAQTQEDDYTRYELLAPGSGQFRILYEVTATRAGAPYFFNAIRKGSVATDERVFDAATGVPLKWEVVDGATARAQGHPRADLETEWIKVYLARPVPAAGEARVVIDKTYKDDKSYFVDGETIVFDRPLGIRRNAVVLPAGYRLVSCNVPSQVLATPEGRVMITFMHPGPAAAPLVLRAARGLAPFTPSWPTRDGGTSWGTSASQAARLVDRAHQDREVTFDLGAPDAHRFVLEHDYTETRAGTAHYLELIAAGQTVEQPMVRHLDTGEDLRAELVNGTQLRERKVDTGGPVASGERAILASFPALPAGHSMRLRVRASIIDPAGYTLDGEELVFEQLLDRPRNAIVLPTGWTTVASAVPVVIDRTPDGRQRLVIENARPDLLQALVRARRAQ